MSPNKIKITFSKRLEIFKESPYNPPLNNHSLTGNYKGFRSINATGDWRALYIQIHKEEVIFVMLGKHSKLYG
jgi:addiction module RelE/StbE family toxin